MTRDNRPKRLTTAEFKIEVRYLGRSGPENLRRIEKLLPEMIDSINTMDFTNGGFMEVNLIDGAEARNGSDFFSTSTENIDDM